MPRSFREAVFSSSEDRIRAGEATTAVAGCLIVCRKVSSDPAKNWIRSAGESLFSVLFPSNCRVCGLPLLNIPRLPVCADCLEAIGAIRGQACSDCGETVLSSYAENRSALKARDSERMIREADILLPTPATQSQIGLTSRQPRKNMRGAVAVAHAAEVTGQEVLLVSDVYTTGTAATECAKVLRHAGAPRVRVATVARRLNSASKYEDIPVGFKGSESQVFGEPDSVEKAEMDDFETLNVET